MNAYLVASSSPSIDIVNDWYPSIVDGHFGGERAGN